MLITIYVIGAGYTFFSYGGFLAVHSGDARGVLWSLGLAAIWPVSLPTLFLVCH